MFNGPNYSAINAETLPVNMAKIMSYTSFDPMMAQG